MASFSIKGDIICFDGWEIARLSSKLPASVVGQIEESLDGFCPAEAEENAEVAAAPDEVLSDFINKLKGEIRGKSRATFVSVDEVSKICDRLAKL